MADVYTDSPEIDGKILSRHIKEKDPDGFTKEVEKSLREKLEILITASGRGIDIYRIGCYYISPSFGNWLRIAWDHESNSRYSFISQIEQGTYIKLYQLLAPRNANLLVHHGLEKELTIEFNLSSSSPQAFQKKHMEEYNRLISKKDIFDLKFDLSRCEVGIPNLEMFLLDAFYTKIEKALSKNEFANLNIAFGALKLDNGDSNPKWINYLFRMFILTYFPTLQVLKKEMEKSENQKDQEIIKPIFVLIKPFSLNQGEKTQDLYACFAISYSKIPKNIDAIIKAVQSVVKEVYTLDLWNCHFASDSGKNLVVVEDIIRECTTIDESVLSYVNKFPKYLDELIGNTHNCGNPDNAKTGKIKGNGRESPCCEFHSLTAEIVCASAAYHDFLTDLKRKINPTYQDDEQNREKDGEQNRKKYREKLSKMNGGDVIYLYSMPGCGKEKIAQLCHLLSWRSLLPIIDADKSLPLCVKDIYGVYFEKDFAENCKNCLTDSDCDEIAAYHLIKTILNNDTWLDGIIKCLKESAQIFDDKPLPGKIYPKYPNSANAKAKVDFRGPYFNYYSINAGAIEDREFNEMLFGVREKENIKYGHFTRAHRTGGTIFLDEFNTMNKKLAIRLLRVFESPHQIYIKNMPKPIELNVFTVIGGNSNRDGLIKEGFSPAVVSRICGNEVTIPPLKERPEDIAVFILHKCLAFNKKKVKATENLLKRIEHSAMRLLCEMPWEENYRGLNFFMDGLLNDMLYSGPAKGVISFGAILKQLRKRDLLSGKTIRIREEAFNGK